MSEAFHMAVERARYRDEHPEHTEPQPDPVSTMSAIGLLDEIDGIADLLSCLSSEDENIARLRAVVSELRARLV